ncbi:MAG: homocysteine S-methyltransferase family protein [Clostridia bacterium]|nr:homocysteine S-methyltransferase family protein [Clostridia bacterium]
MTFREFLNSNIVIFDGAMGTLLQKNGLVPGEHPERMNLTHPQVVQSIHRDYFDAGSNVVCTNTFGANSLKFGSDELEQIVCAAVGNARAAAEQSRGSQQKFVALDIGPSGKLLKPLGDLDFEDAVEVFAQTVRLGVRFGADLILIETMSDSYETKAALLAAKENSDLPVIVSCAYGADGKLLTGADACAMAALLEGMGADAIGANCSLGPLQLTPVIEKLLERCSVPVIFKPNAGLPREKDGVTTFDITPREFARSVADAVRKGVRIAGGCCGTSPEYIKLLSDAVSSLSPLPVTKKGLTVVSSYSHAVTLGDEPVLIGERINPTGKKRFKQALLNGDMDYILGEGVKQQEKGVHVLDVNVGLPGIDEVKMLRDTVCALQSICDLPLQIDTANTRAMEQALRRVSGKPLINSVNGKAESMHSIFPIAKKYGGVIIALTLDENGIPATAEGRVEIAKKILKTAESYGIDKKDIVFDTLVMAVSADNRAARATLDAMRTIRFELGCHTSLGVSNVSFGLPARDALNSTFFAMALAGGLSCAIMNPFSPDMMRTYHSYRALAGLDASCARYIEESAGFSAAVSVSASAPAPTQIADDGGSELKTAIIKGLSSRAESCAAQLLKTRAPMDIVEQDIIPALNTVGDGFENKKLYLPQLLMSAEAAKAAFEQVRLRMSGTRQQGKKIPFVLATVKGDIHDIGKNIVKLLLQNYGFDVVDLGKDVPAETICDAVKAHNAPFAGLCALMTTTVPAMEETITLLKKEAPFCRTVVGGAVLTEDYALRIGADKYAKDAMEAVKYARSIKI